MSLYQKIKELQNNPETSNAGKKWTDDENIKLLENNKNGLSIQEIAKLHKRTETAIHSQLIKQGIHMMNQKNLSEKDVCDILNFI